MSRNSHNGADKEVKMIKYLRVKLPILVTILAASLLSSTPAYGQATVVILNDQDAAGVGFNDTTPVAPIGGKPGTTLGEQRLNAFQFAANIWGATLNSGPTITVRASWEALSCTATTGTLGSASTVTLERNFSNAPFVQTWYSAALGNALAGFDLRPTNPEIRARFNINLGTPGCLQNRTWYLGFDGNEGTGIDLVSVILHELAHGLVRKESTTIETGTDQCIKDIHDTDDLSEFVDLATLEFIGVALPIPPFVGLADDLRQPVMRRSELPQRLIGQFGMLLDERALFRSQAAGFRNQ